MPTKAPTLTIIKLSFKKKINAEKWIERNQSSGQRFRIGWNSSDGTYDIIKIK